MPHIQISDNNKLQDENAPRPAADEIGQEEQNVPAVPSPAAGKNSGGLETIPEVSEEEEEEADGAKPASAGEKNAKAQGPIPEAAGKAGEENTVSEPGSTDSTKVIKKKKPSRPEFSDEEAPAKQETADKPEKDKKGKKSGASRGELLRKKLVDEYKSNKDGGDKDDSAAAGEKSGEKSGKLAKAKGLGDKLSAFADMYDNNKDPQKNFEAFKDSQKKKDKKDDKDKGDKKDETGGKKEAGAPESKAKAETTDPDKEVKDAAKELADSVKNEDSEAAPAPDAKPETKDEAPKKEETKQEETKKEETKQEEPKKEETKQEKADRLVKEAAVALNERASEIAKEQNVTLDKKEEKKEEEKKEEPLPVKEMLTDAAGAFNNGVGAVSSLYAARRSKNRRTKTRGRIRGAQHIMSGIGNLAGGVGTLFNSGKVGSGSGINIAGGALKGASGGLTVFSTILGMLGDRHSRKQSKSIAERAEKISKRSGKIRYDLKEAGDLVKAVRANKGNKNKFASDEEYDKKLALAKKARDNAKANKLAMAIANKFNTQKSKASNKGIGNIISGATQVVSGVLGAVGLGGNSFVKGFLTPVLGKVGDFAKKALDNRDKKNAEKEQKADEGLRMDTIKEYLAGKRDKIKAQFKAVSKSSDLSDDERGAMSAELTDAEADKIALARLGVSIPELSSDKPASDEEMMSGFDKVIMKRANNIMRAFNKDELLEALMLEKDATVEDVAAALKGE